MDLSLKKLNDMITTLNRIIADMNTQASSNKPGFMSADDYIKLKNIEEYANKYVLPSASSIRLGGVKQGQNVSIDTDGVINAIIPQIAKGTNTFLGSFTEKTIPHGLASAPTAVTVTPIKESDGTVGEIWVRWDSTNIYVGNTGPSRVEFAWIAII